MSQSDDVRPDHRANAIQVDMWFAVATVAVTLLLGVGVLTYSDTFAWTILATQVILGAFNVRYGFGLWRIGSVIAFPRYLLLVPLASTILGVWWIAPALSDDEVSPALAVLLWLLISYAASIGSVLVALFVLVPLELIGRSLLLMVRGRFRDAANLIIIGSYLLLVSVFGIVGAMAVSGLPPGPVGSFAALSALLGLDGRYVVESTAALWCARVILVVLLLPLLTLLRSRTRIDVAENEATREHPAR
ncbi:hypothetical protein J2Y69_002043 [Microbacterium resistens]|uniref:Integral membrane protein n=1 Tax=Microbacterium resistens TaxID=156977 RepID=A0ABU1SCU9_9MICO|nr:hypothetical protein [Microbacterium resistens]MDR6867440.1 hypothetical protein [Microbacterium resistens]